VDSIPQMHPCAAEQKARAASVPSEGEEGRHLDIDFPQWRGNGGNGMEGHKAGGGEGRAN
jgi:hypothetical protein